MGIPGVISASASFGYGSNGGYWSVQGYAGGVYVGYGNNGPFAGLGFQWNGINGGYEFYSNRVSLGFGQSFGNGYAGSVGISYGTGGFGYNVGGSSMYMWGQMTPGATNQQGGGLPKDGEGCADVGNCGLYEDETTAYNVMYEQSQNKGVETSAWLTDEGVLMMPIQTAKYDNTGTISDNSYYKIAVKGKQYSVYYGNYKLNLKGQVHTHPSSDAGFSTKDLRLVNFLNGLNVYSIGPSIIHRGFLLKSKAVYSNFGKTKDLLDGKISLN